MRCPFSLLVLLLSATLAFAECDNGVCGDNANNAPATSGSNAKLLYSWTTLDFAWEEPAQRAFFVANGLYIPENNALTGIKAYKDQIYVTVSRWRPGVPASLNKVVQVNGKALLLPYPNWAWQEVSNPGSLQFVQSMEIDSRGWMWILDVGRRNILAHPQNVINAPPKLVIWDINNNCVIRTFIFPDHILAWNASFANDIVVDETHGFAYITNTAGNGGIIVYDWNRNIARKFLHTTLAGKPKAIVPVHGNKYPLGFPSDGIALSHDTKTLYYAAISSPHRFSVPTDLLRDFTLTFDEIGKGVVDHGPATFTDGMAFTDDGRLIFGDYAHGAVFAWDVKLPINKGKKICADEKLMQWPDTFAFDGKGNLLFTSNKLHKYVFGEMAFDGSDGDNWRIWSVPIGASSYLTKRPVPAADLVTCEQQS